jgi:hypothetical protein
VVIPQVSEKGFIVYVAEAYIENLVQIHSYPNYSFTACTILSLAVAELDVYLNTSFSLSIVSVHHSVYQLFKLSPQLRSKLNKTIVVP